MPTPLRDLRGRGGRFRDVLLNWLEESYVPGDLFSIYRIADQLDAWEPNRGRPGLGCAKVSMPIWKLHREGRLWKFADVERRESNERYILWSLPLRLASGRSDAR